MHPSGKEFMVSEKSWRMMKCIDGYNEHILIVALLYPKNWDTMIKADRTLSYDLISSMEPTNIIHENKEIPPFCFRIPGTEKYTI